MAVQTVASCKYTESKISHVTFQPMFEAMLEDDKELLQWGELRVQRPAQAQGGLNQYFDAQLHHAEEIGSLY